MDIEKDELYIVGDIHYQDWLIDKVKQHLKFCRVINQEVYFNNSQLAKRTDIPYDMKTIYTGIKEERLELKCRVN